MFNVQHINWHPRPSKGDMQVTWRYEFPNGLPHGLKNKMLAICQGVAYHRTYQHMWKDGVLFILGEVTADNLQTYNGQSS